MFDDREDAGNQLADQLKSLDLVQPLVLAIPRGGIATGAAIARALDAELDVVLAHKLRAPWQPELAVGAVGESGEMYLNERVARSIGLGDEHLAGERRLQMEEIERRQRLFRSAREPAAIEGRSVILTDDGIATGSTMLAAAQVVRGKHPRETIIAVPVAPPNRLDTLRAHCDRLVCLHAPDEFWSVGQFYRRFDQVSDQQVVDWLREFSSSSSH